MSGYDYGDEYDYEYGYEYKNNRNKNNRRRRRKRRHPIFFLLLIAAIFVLSYQGIRNWDWEDPVPAAQGETGKGAIAQDAINDSTIPKDTAQALEAMAQEDPKARPIVQNPGQYPERLLESLGRNPELLDFTLDYPEKKGTFSKKTDLSGQYHRGKIPLLLQWDEKWGYAPYGDGIVGLDGCGPTCLSMVAIGLTGDTARTPKEIADFSERNGYLDEKSNSTLWTLMSEGAGKLGLNSREIPLSKSRMTGELSQGNPIICCMGPGDFTTQGHFIVLCGVQNGEFSIRDPNSRKRSGETWSYETLKPQIRNLWAFSA